MAAQIKSGNIQFSNGHTCAVQSVRANVSYEAVRNIYHQEHYTLDYDIIPTKVTIDWTYLYESAGDIALPTLGELFSISLLGDVETCSHCGFALKPGVVFCHRCGSHMRTNTLDAAYYSLSRARIMQASYNVPYDDVVSVDLTMQIDGAIDSVNIERIVYGSTYFTTHAADKYICSYCKGINTVGEDCNFCGAGQLPYTSLGKLKTTCMYCGRELKGNTVCAGCGNADNGFVSWFPRVEV